MHFGGTVSNEGMTDVAEAGDAIAQLFGCLGSGRFDGCPDLTEGFPGSWGIVGEILGDRFSRNDFLHIFRLSIQRFWAQGGVLKFPCPMGRKWVK